MRIVCPECGATYDVPDAALTRPRSVRCAQCGVTWMPAPAGPSSQERIGPAAPGKPADVAMDAPPVMHKTAPEMRPGSASEPPPPEWEAPADRTPGGSRIDRLFGITADEDDTAADSASVLRVAAGWLASLVLLAGIGWAAVTWRHDVVALWPASERLFHVLGYYS